MKSTATALIVCEDADMLWQLEKALADPLANTWPARTCREATELVAHRGIPELIFTQTEFADGSWRSILNLAQTVFPTASVILVTRLEDMRLYLDAMNEGVVDYIIPPFEAFGIAHVIQSALNGLASRRKAARRLAAAG